MEGSTVGRTGTALGHAVTNRAVDRLFAWPPSVSAVIKNGPLALTSSAALCLATIVYTMRLKEESHTPDILKMKKSKKKGDAGAGEEPEQNYAQWSEDEMGRRKPKLLHLTNLASEALKSGEKCHVKFNEMFEACTDVRALDHRDPDLGRSFSVATSLLMRELAEVTAKARAQKLATGEDVAKLIRHYSYLHAMCRGLSMERQARDELWAKVRALWWQTWGSQLELWRMRLPDVVKAFRVVLLARKYIPYLVISSLFKVSSNGLSALETLYKAEALETFRKRNFTMGEVVSKMVAATVVGACRVLTTLVGDRINLIAMMRLHHRLRTEVYSSMLRQDLEWYRLGQQDQRDIHGLFGEVFRLPDLASTFVNSITRTLETGLSVLTVGSLVRQRSTGFMFVVVACEAGVSVAKTVFEVVQAWLKAMLTRTMTRVEQNWVEPLMPENITTVRSCAAESKVLSNWNMFFKTEHESHNQRELVNDLFKPLDFITRQGAWLTMMRRSAHLLQTGQIPFVGDVQSLQELGTKLGTTVWEAVWCILAVKDTIPKLARTYELIFTQPDIGLEGGIVPTEDRAEGSVEFRGVSFKYPGTSEVLKDVSFKVGVQNSFGITGSTGAGKSTLLLLIQRLYDATEGQILIDGMDIKTLNPLWVRRQMAVVSQRPRIFHTSLLKNLVYGCNPDPSDAEVEAACKAARIYDVIFNNPARFPLGLHTRVSNETLSGGELQRVAIARALLQDSPILLLDEATSALDSESQSLVKEGLKTLMRGRTVITVAHRLETIKDSNMILCVEGGEVKESGTHQELVQTGGIYSRLYREQIESTVSARACEAPPAEAAQAAPP